MIKYCLVGDDSGHDYVIPSDKRDEWYELMEDDVPDWAERVEGGLEFENPSEDGILLFPKRYKIVISYQTGGFKDVWFDWNKSVEPYHGDVFEIIQERSLPYEPAWDSFKFWEV